MGWEGYPLSVPLGLEKYIQIEQCGVNENLVDMECGVRFNY
jgi:hypothetical protein